MKMMSSLDKVIKDSTYYSDEKGLSDWPTDEYSLVFMTYHRVCNKSNMTTATSDTGGAGTTCSSVAPWFLVQLLFFNPKFSV